ncbi:MAG TPA: hypothetical protein VGN17_27170 [Bryobacteraceae bacterium]|jgi:hypothetical protein
MKVAALLLSLAGLAAAQSLDFEAYRSKVEPIFLKKREGHSRCVSCHSANHSSLVLQPLDKGATKYTVAQSHKNFDSVKNLVVPGKPEKSKLLLHPLAQDAGGDEFHSGGRQFLSKDDPDWKVMADWVRGAK